MHKNDKRKLNIYTVISLILTGFLLLSACTRNQPENSVEHPLDGDGEINYAAMSGAQEEPEVYGCAIYLKVRAEFVIYINDQGRLISFMIKNDDAVKVAERAALNDVDCFEAVREIFRMSIEELSIDTENEDMSVDLIENRLSDEKGSEILQMAIDGANAALAEKNKTGQVNYTLPEGMVFVDPKDLNHPDAPEEPNRRPEEDHPNFNAQTDEWVCASQEEIDSVIAFVEKIDPQKSHYPIRISGDFNLSLNSAAKYDGLSLECDGHNIKVSGNFVFDKEGAVPLELIGAKSVDLSGLSVDMESAKNLKPAGPRPEETEEQAYWNTQNAYVDIIRIKDTPENNIIIPELFQTRGMERSEKDYSIFEPYCVYEVRDNQIILMAVGPRDEYEARNEKETKVLNQLFANGEYHSLTGQTSNNFYYICTDITMDIGECTLPNMDYDAISVGKGGHLTLTGTLYITGGTFKMETYQHDGLDLRGLTIVKKHPSPDMIHIGYNPEEGIEDDLYKCKTASGTIYYSKSSEKVSITVW